MIYCTSCGTENVDSAQFCYKCGAVQVPAASPPTWPGNSQLNKPQAGASSTAPGYGFAPNYPPGNYPQPYAPPYPYNQPPVAPNAYGGHQMVGHGAYSQGGPMSLTGMIMGIVSISFLAVGLVPCLGWVNWFTLIIAGLSNIFCWIGLSSEGKDPASRSKATTGLILSFIAIFIGMIRLAIGRGIF